MNEHADSSVSMLPPAVINNPRIDQLPLYALRHVGNWRDPQSYPLPDSKNYKVWAWEFLRRNAEYGAFALWCATLPEDLRTRQKPKSSDLVEHLVCMPPAPASVRTYGDYKKWCREEKQNCTVQTPNQVLRSAWGITYPLLPSEKFPATKKAKTRFKRAPQFLSTTISHFLPAWAQQNKGCINYPGIRNIATNLNPDEILIRFRIDEPIEKQTKRAGVFLDRWQRRYLKARHIKIAPQSAMDDIPKPKSETPKNRVDLKAVHYMLRILDAAHDPILGQNELSQKIVRDLLKKFGSEKELDDFMSGEVAVADSWEPPTFSAAQVRSWYNMACHYVTQNGYLAVAAYVADHKKRKK